MPQDLAVIATALPALAHATVITDPSGAILWMNPAFSNLTGYTFAEAAGQNLRQLESGEPDPTFYRDLLPLLLQTGVCHTERVSRRKDGTTYHEDQTITPVTGDHGEIIRLIAIKQDISARKHDEHRTRLLVHAIKSTGEFISITDPSNHILFVNDAFLNAYGYTNQELVGQHINIVRRRQEDRQVDDEILPATLKGTWRGEAINRRKDGTEFPISLSTSVVLDDHGAPVALIGVARDITENRLAAARLAEANNRLVEISRMSGMADVASAVLHSAGNVLNSVIVSATIVADRLRDSRIDKLAATVQMMEQHSANLAEFLTDDPKGRLLLPYLAKLALHFEEEHKLLVRELGQLSDRIGHIKQIIATQEDHAATTAWTEEVSLRHVMDDALRIQHAFVTRHGIRIECRFADLPPIRTDKHRVFQILLNLLRNACQAVQQSPNSERLVHVRTLTAPNDKVRVEVQDSGIGIAPENLTRIFAQGFAAKPDGFSAGLHSSALAAMQLGGSLAAQSDGLNLGATLILELPIGNPDSAEPK